MASRMLRNYRDIPELSEFFLNDVRKTGKMLGSGAFGIVEELSVGGTICAGKMLHTILLNELNEGADKLKERFISECRLMSKVRHPNIVQFMGLCLYDDCAHPVLVMEEVDTSLECILESHKNLPLPLILHILHDITKGLVYLHDSQKPPIVHRDLTARNVLVDKASMKAKIADLGNALMIDPIKLSITLTQAPGTLPYMPPEALVSNPKYDTSLDMFSFGHLALFTVLQEYPGELMTPTYSNKMDKLVARSEVQRRKKYIDMLKDRLTKDHLVTKMIIQCLNNIPAKRLTAKAAMDQIEDELGSEEDDPYISVDLVELMKRATEKRKSFDFEALPTVEAVDSNTQSAGELVIQSGPVSVLQHRVEELKKGVPAIMKVYRLCGKIMRKFDWRQHVFQIKDGKLMYLKTHVVDKVYDSLNLSLVVHVEAIESEDRSAFEFEVHFSGGTGSPWRLRAYTTDDRTCWMEAIKPGSCKEIMESGDHRDADDQCYEPLDMYDYAINIQPPSPQKTVESKGEEKNEFEEEESDDEHFYDDPELLEDEGQAVPIPSSPQPYCEPVHSLSPEDVDSPLQYDHLPADSTKGNFAEIQQEGEADEKENPEEIYEIIDNEASPSLTSESPTAERKPLPLPPLPQPPLACKTATLPLGEKQHTFSTSQKSASIPRNLSSLFELSIDDLSELTQSEVQVWMLLQMQKMVQKMEDVYETAPAVLSPKLTDKQPIPSLPPQEVQDEIEKGHGDPQPTKRGVNYVNMDDLEKALSGDPPPPLPPRTYKGQSSDEFEKEKPKKKTDKGSTKNVYSLQPQTPVGHKLLKQKLAKNISQSDMIDTLRAKSAALSPEISSHLVTDYVIEDEEEEEMYITGKRERRPDWAKANTSSSVVEPTLSELQQKALFLSRSSLTNLRDIGQGQYGKVYKGTYKRVGAGGAGVQVAIKTIKKYESSKEKDSFLKEMNVMSKLLHPNIVRLFGLVQQDEPWIVLEYLPNGDLKKFLTKNNREVHNLVKYMLDVATGMHYISERGLLHRDLAARNIMVSQDEICKVGDFGLLRELPKDSEIYVATSKIFLPIKWMAPESLPPARRFSTASDVWSFGVLMWEMNNPTQTPYKGLGNLEYGLGVKDGLRLDIPDAYPPTVASIMKACWQHNPSKRPSFLLIASLLTSEFYGAQ